MDRAVNHEASCIYSLVGSTDTLSLVVDLDHVRHSQKTKVHAIRIEPECVGVNRIYCQSNSD